MFGVRGGHIGAQVSALVDGQLAAAEEERAWRHVLGCAGCRALVANEGSMKRRLAGLAQPVGPETVPSALLGSLYQLDAWAQVDEIEAAAQQSRRTVGALIGAGSLGLAMAALVAVGGLPGGEAPNRTLKIDLPASPSVLPTPSAVTESAQPTPTGSESPASRQTPTAGITTPPLEVLRSAVPSTPR